MLKKVFSLLAVVAMVSIAQMGISYADCAEDLKSCFQNCEANKYDINSCKGLNEDKVYDSALERCDLEAGQALGVCSEGCKTTKEKCEKPETKKAP